MKRRTLLEIGGSALGLAVAGCLDDGADPGDEDEGDDEADDRDEPDGEDGDEDEDDGGDAEDEDTEDGDERDEDDSEGETDDSSAEGEEEPEVVDTEFEVVSTGGGGEGDGEARVNIDGETVRVEGSIVGRNGCYTARLEEAVVEEGTLVVRVEAYEDADEGEMCTQALVVIEYGVRIELAGEVTEVRVEHDGEEIASEG